MYSNTQDGFFNYLWGKSKNLKKPLKLEVNYFNEQDDVPRIVVKALLGEVFGPQPFLSIKRKDGKYVNDNFDFDLKKEFGITLFMTTHFI